MFRSSSLTLSLGMAVMLLACGLFDDERKAAESQVAAPQVASTGVLYDGPKSLEERIFSSPVIVRVRLSSVSSATESGPTLYGTKFIPLLEFNFRVLEYLKGNGGSDIAAVWDAAPLFDTRQEAEAALPEIAAARDTQWDDREAIVFLKHSQSYLASTQQTGRYYLSQEYGFHPPDDRYSIASRFYKLWLPAVSASSQPNGDTQRFLLDVPPETGEAPTITLGEMKARIAAVEARLNAGDGSEEYSECVFYTYIQERQERYFKTEFPNRDAPSSISTLDHAISSGMTASTTLYEDHQGFGYALDNRDGFWLDGGDSGLFSVELGDAVHYDSTGDGVNDAISFDRRVVTVRPLPQGVYKFHSNELSAYFRRCDGYTWRHEWTVTVNAPDGVLHEAFFDPVTVGNAVVADGGNGVLKPSSFTGANGATTTIERIGWESGNGRAGTVKLELSPHSAIANHIVDFIALDGSVSLSLNVTTATVDAANDTLSWPVASRPWRSGDKLMLRIREASQ